MNPINNHMHLSLIDALADKPIKIAGKHLMNVNKNTNVNKISNKTSKTVTFSSELNFDEVLTAIESIKPADFLNLFIFIINFKTSTKDEAEYGKLKDSLIKFDATRPIIMQLVFEDGSPSKIYLKNSSSQFEIIDVGTKMSFSSAPTFPSFLSSFLQGEFEAIFEDIITNFPTIQESFLIFRFLKTLDLNEEFFKIFILKCAAYGNKDDFLAALDASFDEKQKKLSPDGQKYLSTVFVDEDIEDEDEDETMRSTEDLSQNHPNSVLLTAVEHKNFEVISCIINSWSDFCRKLPFNHQVRISTAALESNQLDVLCDLLDIADFPFPEYFKVIDENKHERLNKILSHRAEIVTAISEDNYEKTEDLIKKNSYLKIIYSINNNSTLKETINANKLGIYYYLRTFGLVGEDCKEFIDKLSDKEKQKAIRLATIQKTLSVNNALPNNQQAALMLCTKSLIHNKKITKEQEQEYRKKIRSWYENINNAIPDVVDVAASSEMLKIIYDFDSESVENVSLTGPNSPGITFVSSKWIFIGAKISGRERELEITAVLAQQLCYFVLHIVFENNGKPYYKESFHLAEIFDEIVKSINKWSAPNTENPNDECFGMISSVFTRHQPKDFQMELILRVVHILTEFAKDEEFLKNIQRKYKSLFNFYYHFVVPELKLFQQKEEEIVRLNGYINLLYTIKERKIELLDPKDFKDILKNKVVVISTNVPALLLNDIFCHLKKTYGCLLATKNIFADPERFTNDKVRSDFQQFCHENRDMNVIADVTKGITEMTDVVFANKKNNFVFVAINNAQRDEVVNKALKICGVNPELLEINYSWVDLTPKSQKNLLKFKINFQNNESLSLSDVLGCQNSVEFHDIADIIDDQLLNFLLEKEKITINSTSGDDMQVIKFEFISKPRKFISSKPEASQIPEKDFIKIIKNKPCILISDKAGTGKTFAIKNAIKLYKEKYPTRWLTYVDLKLFTKELKKQKEPTDLPTFLVEKILKLKINFEVRIFEKLYKDGRVCIILDGFDEISPDYAELVVKLAQSFTSNAGNQLWIATRDYFEADLLKKLKINEIFKINNFLTVDGIDLIAKSWAIVDTHRDLTPKKFEDLVVKSPKLENYQKIAEKIVKRLETISNKPIVIAQDFKLIADSFRDGKFQNFDDTIEPDLNRFRIFRIIGIIYYKIWSNQKGEVRQDANVTSQGYELNFWRFHQFVALSILFPAFIEEFFPYYENTEWSEVEAVACGILSYKDGKPYFYSDNLRDFFMAELITREIKRKKLGKIIFITFVKILTCQSHKGVQIILNDAIEGEPELIEGYEQKFLEFVDDFCKMDNFEDFFINKLDCLTNMIMNILKNGSSENAKEMLGRTAVKLIKSTKDSGIYGKFEEILMSFLNDEDLKALIKEQDILHRIIQSELDIEVFERLITKLEAKYPSEFIKKLISINSTQPEGNIMHCMSTSADYQQSKLTKFFKIVQKYLKKSEIIELISNCNQNEDTVLNLCVQKENEEFLTNLWTEIENSCGLEVCKDLIVKKSSKNQQNILHYVAANTKLEVHQKLWKLLVENIENHEKLRDLILQINQNGLNFLQLLITSNKPEIIEFSIKNLKENFKNLEFQQTLTQKDSMNLNLLQIAAKNSKEVKTHQILWTEL